MCIRIYVGRNGSRRGSALVLFVFIYISALHRFSDGSTSCSIPSEIIKDWIVKPLRDQHVKPKAAATFKCELFKDTPNWKWLKGENEIVPSDKVEVKQDGKELTLTIKNCQPEDVAEYAMEVEGRVYTAKLTLGGSSI